jgi:hypothetical protein
MSNNILFRKILIESRRQKIFKKMIQESEDGNKPIPFEQKQRNKAYINNAHNNNKEPTNIVIEDTPKHEHEHEPEIRPKQTIRKFSDILDDKMKQENN